MAASLIAASAGMLVLSVGFFFGGPIVLSLLATACALVVFVKLRASARSHPAVTE